MEIQSNSSADAGLALPPPYEGQSSENSPNRVITNSTTSAMGTPPPPYSNELAITQMQPSCCPENANRVNTAQCCSSCDAMCNTILAATGIFFVWLIVGGLFSQIANKV